MPNDNRPFPIQGGTARNDEGRGDWSRPIVRFAPCHIPWWLAEVAYESYVKCGGAGQSLERLAERGGFGRYELVALIRREYERTPSET